jgi:hypothetical protein
MIIEAPYTVNDIVSLKLASGEEMIARLVAEDATHATVTKPLMLIAADNGMGLAPFMFTVSPEAKIKLKINSIICIVKSAKDAVDIYTKQTSGLATV